MALQEKLHNDLKDALRGGRKEQAGALRLLLSQLHNREIEKQGKSKESALTEEEVVEVLQREMKKRRESIDLFRKGGRNDLAEKEEGEAKIIQEYLPRPLSEKEIATAVDEIIASGAGEFNAVIKEAMKRLKGKADGRTVGDIIKKKLQ